MDDDPITSEAVLGADGLIARRLPTYEHRPQQLEMAATVSDVLQQKQHLVVEAGTGVGKSFGYLVPAILEVTAPQASEDRSDDADSSPDVRRIVISTETISLQEQLLKKDIPLLNSVIPREFTCVLGKGRGNYVSLRRLKLAQQRAASLFFDEEHLAQLDRIARWSRETTDGSRSDLDVMPSAAVWDEVASDHGNCLGRKCPTYNSCFYYQARRRLQQANLLIVNHALFFTDLSLRAAEASILPDYDAVILDEAHTMPAAAREHLGTSLSSGQIEFALSRLYNERTQRGLFVHLRWQAGQRAVSLARQVTREFFADIDSWADQNQMSNGRVRDPNIVNNPLTRTLEALAKEVAQMGQQRKEESDRQDLLSVVRRLEVFGSSVGAWLRQEQSDSVHWIERPRSRRRFARIVLRSAPVNIGPVLREQLYQRVPSVVMTSATLAVGRQANFDYFKQAVGLTQCRVCHVGSPFDYRRQVELVIVHGMPDPVAQQTEYGRMCATVIQRYLQANDGRTFVLFTSYRMLRDVADRIARWLSDHDLALYNQSDGTPRTRLLKLFKENPRGVLLGTSSFWQGVDVPGDALKCVMITRLPFSVPDHPLVQAQMESIQKAGGQPFFDHQIPEAIIRLRQGFGRLVRSQADTGQVVILDPRIVTKPYGRYFIESLPECEMVEDFAVGAEEN